MRDAFAIVVTATSPTTDEQLPLFHSLWLHLPTPPLLLPQLLDFLYTSSHCDSGRRVSLSLLLSQVFIEQAIERKAYLFRARPWKEYAAHIPANEQVLALEGNFQHLNASVAIGVAHVLIESLRGTYKAPAWDPENPPKEPPFFPLAQLSKPYLDGLHNTFWPGRAQTIEGLRDLKNVSILLDGGHTRASLKESAEWWLEHVKAEPDAMRVFVFNCRQNKPAPALLTPVVTAITDASLPYTAAYFVASKVRKTRDHSNDITNILDDDVTQQVYLQKLWKDLETEKGNGHETPTHIFPAIDDALDALYKLAKENPSRKIYLHVTGSLYLVGGFLECLGYEI